MRGRTEPSGGRYNFCEAAREHRRHALGRDGSPLSRQIVGTVPPSMTYSLPVIEAARSDARKATSSATSAGRAGRPSGMTPSDDINCARRIPVGASGRRQTKDDLSHLGRIAILLAPERLQRLGAPNRWRRR
jgi:hypothetical protein